MYTRRIEHSRGNKIYNILTVYHHCALSGILPPLRSSEWHYCHLERKWEISYKAHYLARDSSGLFIPRRMTLHHKVLQLLSFRTETYGRVWEISGYPRKILRCFAPQNDMCRKGVNTLQGILHFAYASFRMTMLRNFFPAAKKSPRKVARLLSGIPAFRFTRRRGLRNSLCSNSPRPISAFSLAPGSPIKAGTSSTPFPKLPVV